MNHGHPDVFDDKCFRCMQDAPNEDKKRKPRKPNQADLERVVGHFLYYLSNEPDKRTGISPRQRFYGMLPVEAKMLMPDVSDEVILRAVETMFRRTEDETDIVAPARPAWRTYS